MPCIGCVFPTIYLSSLDCLSLGTDCCVSAYHPSSSFCCCSFSSPAFLSYFCCCCCCRRLDDWDGRRDGYRLNEHFHMKNHEAKTTTNIEMTNGLLSEDDDCPCCIAAGCSPVVNNTNSKYELNSEF